MRAVNRLRTQRFRSNVLPILLAALLFRVLVPPGFMMVGGDLSLRAAMCTTTPGKIEKIELPGADTRVHCEYCVAPPLGAPRAATRIEAPARMASSAFTRAAAQVSNSPLVRAQSARAPPFA
jgi:hypothetical protein